MYKKDKNKISQTGKNGPLSGSADCKTGKNGQVNIGIDSKTSKPTGKSVPLGSNTDCKSTPLSGGADYKTTSRHIFLSKKLYLLILVGLTVSVLLMIAGFGLNFITGDTRNLSLEGIQEHALNPDDLIDLINNGQLTASMLLIYTGLLAMILVPAAGLIYITGYFIYKKQNTLALTAAGVLFILILSALIGLLKS